MTADRGCDVWHAAIADFYIVAVEQFCERGVLEMAINQLQEGRSHIGLHVAAEWWVEPSNVAFSFSLFLSSFALFRLDVLDRFRVSTCGQGCILHRCCLAEGIGIRGVH